MGPCLPRSSPLTPPPRPSSGLKQICKERRVDQVLVGWPGSRSSATLGICAKDMPGAFQKRIQPKNGHWPPSPPCPHLSAQTPRRGASGKPVGRDLKWPYCPRSSHESQEVTVTCARLLSPRSQDISTMGQREQPSARRMRGGGHHAGGTVPACLTR